MGLTLEQLQKMGGKPGVSNATTAVPQAPVQAAQPQSKGLSIDQLRSMGAKEGIQAPPPSPSETPTNEDRGLIGNVFDDIGSRLSKAGGNVADIYQGKLNPLSGGIQLAGNVMGTVSDVAGDVINKIPGVSQAQQYIGKKVGEAAQTPVGQKVVGAVGAFQKAHPEISQDISSLGDVVGGLSTVIGAGALKKGITSGIGKVFGKDAVSSIASDISPELTAKGAAKSIAKGGTEKSLITGKISPVLDSRALEDAAVVQKNVPGFRDLKTFSDKVNATRSAVSDMAESLKNDVIQSGKDRIYPVRELESKISAAEEPISLKGTPFEKQIAPIKDAAIKIAKDKGGTISSLFDARKDFDALVNKTYPTLWDKENAPMRAAVKAVRDTMNQYISDNLPNELDFKARLLEQSKLFNAIDNMAPKAVAELGTSRLSRFGAAHPILRSIGKNAVRGAAELGGLGLLYKGYQSLKGD